MDSAKEKGIIRIGMAEYKVANSPSKLMCVGLGSCIGIVLYDGFNRTGGLAHIMLPKRSVANNKAKRAKFADSAIDLMLRKMQRKNSMKRNIRAKIFGGANMFENIRSSTLANIGKRNVAAVKDELKKQKIKLVAEDTGGKIGRTIIFSIEDGSVIVRNAFGEQKVY